MIPRYPHFASITTDIRDEYQKVISRFEPYSDFNFVSLLSWDNDGSAGVSVANDCVIIKLPDYTTNQTIYSVLGDNNVDGIINKLLSSKKRLSLVPQITVDSIYDRSAFTISPDRNNYDYIYRISDLVSLPGRKYKVKRNKISQFSRIHHGRFHVQNIVFSNEHHTQLIRTVCDNWSKQRGKNANETANEFAAIEKLIKHSRRLNLTGILVFIDEECVGFSINEVLGKYSICHFQKALLAFDHIDVYISLLTAKELYHFGCTFINWEQDLGEEGLRELKKSYQNCDFLKKYTVVGAN